MTELSQSHPRYREYVEVKLDGQIGQSEGSKVETLHPYMHNPKSQVRAKLHKTVYFGLEIVRLQPETLGSWPNKLWFSYDSEFIWFFDSS